MFCPRFGRKDRFCIASARIWKYRASQLFLTRKLLTFLSRLNEISGGCKKIVVNSKCESEWNSVIFFLFVTFVVLIVDHFVERGDGPFELQKQDSHVFRKTGKFLLIQKRFLKTRNCKNER